MSSFAEPLECVGRPIRTKCNSVLVHSLWIASLGALFEILYMDLLKLCKFILGPEGLLAVFRGITNATNRQNIYAGAPKRLIPRQAFVSAELKQ